MAGLPTTRPSRVVIEPVSPVVDGGRYPAKAGLGEPVTVVADVFGEGHDAVAAAYTAIPMVIMALYLVMARRLGAFEAL